MEGVMRRPFPDVPWLSAFPELNVRVYVTHGGRRGVWFLSLDATNPLAVWAARRFFHLPYHEARMRLEREGDRYAYLSERRAGGAVFEGAYRPVSDPYEARPGTLEHFLTERYCLYARSPAGALLRCDVHHVPWPLQRAEADVTRSTMLAPHGLAVEGAPALAHFAKRLDVVVWSPERV